MTIATLAVTFLLLHAFNLKAMLPIDLAILAAAGVYWLIHHPRKPKPHPPAVEDVWQTIARARKTLEDSYDLIYDRKPK